MTQLEILDEIRNLCKLHKFDEAIKMTSEIENKQFATRAHLLCMDYEQAVKNK